MSADRNLLFGILAVQSGFCTGPQLVEAMNAWSLAKQRALGDILLERGFLQSDEHDLLAALVAKQLTKHGGDAEKSLAALSPTPRLAAQIAGVVDSDLQLTLAAFSATSEDVDRTCSAAPGATEAGVRYRILRPHARGGLGEVFVARDAELGREVALKEIQPQFADDVGSRSRFVREAEVTGGLEHPGIVAVYGLGTYADGRPFYAMRFIQGDSLKEAIARFHAGGKPGFAGSAIRQLLGRFVDVCQAIAYAHARGVLHRDLKPGNIMLGKFGETLVVDWGLAKVAGVSEPSAGEGTLAISSGSGETPTVQGQAIGTPAFMSPEQAAGRLDELGPATDIYSLGATLYALLANRPPIQAADLPETLRKAQSGEWTPLRTVNPAIPAALAAVCAKAMAVRAGDRFASAQDLAADVERYLSDEPLAVYREPLAQRAGRWARKHRTGVATAAAAVTVAALAAAVGNVVQGRHNAELAERNFKLAAARQDAERERREALEQRDRAHFYLESILDLRQFGRDLRKRSIRRDFGITARLFKVRDDGDVEPTSRSQVANAILGSWHDKQAFQLSIQPEIDCWISVFYSIPQSARALDGGNGLQRESLPRCVVVYPNKNQPAMLWKAGAARRIPDGGKLRANGMPLELWPVVAKGDPAFLYVVASEREWRPDPDLTRQSFDGFTPAGSERVALALRGLIEGNAALGPPARVSEEIVVFGIRGPAEAPNSP